MRVTTTIILHFIEKFFFNTELELEFERCVHVFIIFMVHMYALLKFKWLHRVFQATIDSPWVRQNMKVFEFQFFQLRIFRYFMHLELGQSTSTCSYYKCSLIHGASFKKSGLLLFCIQALNSKSSPNSRCIPRGIRIDRENKSLRKLLIQIAECYTIWKE